MASIIDLVRNDFEKVFASLLMNRKVELTVEDLMDTSNSYILEELELIKGSPNVIETERSQLKNFIILMEEAEEPIDYDESINQKLFSYVINYSGIKSFEFFHIRYIVSHYADGGLDYTTIPEYYKGIFENHSELILLDDFFDRSDFLIPILLLENPPKDLTTIFKSAIDKYPGKALLKFTLAQMFNQRKDYQQSLLWHLHFAGQVESERAFNDYTIEDYHISISNIAHLCFYKIKDHENASIYSEVCLTEYQSNGEEIYSLQYLFLDPMLIRLRLCISNKNNEVFRQNYDLLRSKVDDSDFDALDIDDIKEFAKRLKM